MHCNKKRTIEFITSLITFIVSVTLPGISFVDDSVRLGTLSAATAASVSSPFHYHFRVPGVLNETGSMHESSSPYFWLNSGGQLILSNGRGYTYQGEVPTGNVWQTLYAASNSLDTEGGHLPQNLFRLVTRSKWDNVSARLRFTINDIHLTDTPNRDGYSGILLMSRYKDGNNLYYAGIRMDGTAVIKKKKNSVYTTLAQTQVFGSSASYSKFTNPNLLPEHSWMGIRFDTRTDSNNTVHLTLYVDENDDGAWRKLLQTQDTTGGNDGTPLYGSGFAGIRTDYLDATFDDYVLRNI